MNRACLCRCVCLVAPLRIARGIQNKLLEALAMGLPSVASVATCKATVVPQGEGLLAEDQPQAFASAVVKLLKDDAYRADMRFRLTPGSRGTSCDPRR